MNKKNKLYEIKKVPPLLTLSQIPDYFPLSERLARDLVATGILTAKTGNFTGEKKAGRYFVKAQSIIEIMESLPDYNTVNPSDVTT